MISIPTFIVPTRLTLLPILDTDLPIQTMEFLTIIA